MKLKIAIPREAVAHPGGLTAEVNAMRPTDQYDLYLEQGVVYWVSDAGCTMVAAANCKYMVPAETPKRKKPEPK